MNIRFSGKKRARWLGALLLLSGTLAVMAIACSSAEEPAAPAPVAPAPAPVAPAAAPAPAVAPAASPGEPSGEVRIALSGELQPASQRPSKEVHAIGGLGLQLGIWEDLLRAPHTPPPATPPQTGFEGAVAESWKIAPDFTSITFKIRQGLNFHAYPDVDWGEVTATDVAWTFNDAWLPESTNNGAEETPPPHKAGMDVMDQYTVRMNIEDGQMAGNWEFFFGDTGFGTYGIVSKKAFDDLGADDYAKTPIGTGPYVAEQWTANDRVVMHARTDHYTGVPKNKTVRVFNMPEAATRESALRAGEVHLADLALSESNAYLKDVQGSWFQPLAMERPVLIQMAGNYWDTVCPLCEGGLMPKPGWDEAMKNPDQYPWISDPNDPASMERGRKVRWAMAMAIDRQEILDEVLFGKGALQWTWANQHEGDPAFNDEWIIPFDPEGARKLLAEAGFPNGFEMEAWIQSSWPDDHVRASLPVPEYWRENLNINVTVDRTVYAARRPTTVDKSINTPFSHGQPFLPGSTLANNYLCPRPGHILGVTLLKEACSVGDQNATEQNLLQRQKNLAVMQDFITKWMLVIPVVRVGSGWTMSPEVQEWDPFNTTFIGIPNIKSLVLK